MTLKLAPGYHVNSDSPGDPYLIPLKLSWNKGPVEAGAVRYPAPERRKLPFSDQPVAIFSGTFDIVTSFHVAPGAGDMGLVSGKLRYQACNDKECLQPKTLNVQFSVDIGN